MAQTTSFNIQRALVRTLRADSAIQAAAPGGEYEGIAPRDTAMPFITYTLVSDPYDFTNTSRTIRAAYDVVAVAGDQVEASNLDSLIANALEGSLQAVDGQTTLVCRRTNGLRDSEETAAGDMIFRIGGTYEIWTDQPL